MVADLGRLRHVAASGQSASPVLAPGMAEPGGRRDYRRRRIARVLGGVLLAALLAGAPARAGLLERLERGETITVVALGDSLAAGFELAEPKRDAYPAVLGSILQRRYPKARVRIVSAGIPGDTAWGGAGRLERDVLWHDPDLVTVQFGGNDHGRGRPPAEFRRDLESIVRRVRQRNGAAVILATPPIVSPDTDTPMVRAVKDVGEAEGIPVADFDGAIRARGTGPRGPFPFGRHPDPYLHAAMSRSLYEALHALAPEGKHVGVRVAEGVRYLPRAGEIDVDVQVNALDPGPVTVILECDGVVHQRVVNAGLDGAAAVSFRVPLAEAAAPVRRRLLVWARAGNAFGYDLRWLTAAPVLRVGRDGVVIGERGLVVGGSWWKGNQDLSGRASLSHDGDRLHLTVTVEDDRLVRNNHLKDAFESDCVEAFLDSRPEAAQARPYWEPGVVGLFLRPGTPEDPEASWSSLEPLPDAWQALDARSAPMPGGYRIDLRLPRSLLGEPSPRYVGFDLALDDADGPRGRRTQMVWAGGADNFLDPSLFGVLDLRPEPWGDAQMRVCVW